MKKYIILALVFSIIFIGGILGYNKTMFKNTTSDSSSTISGDAKNSEAASVEKSEKAAAAEKNATSSSSVKADKTNVSDKKEHVKADTTSSPDSNSTKNIKTTDAEKPGKVTPPNTAAVATDKAKIDTKIATTNIDETKNAPAANIVPATTTPATKN